MSYFPSLVNIFTYYFPLKCSQYVLFCYC
jgi:hypothetical protein